MTEPESFSHKAEHRQLARANRYAASVVFNIVDGLAEISSVLDLGCGTGVWMQAALRRPGRHAFGVEIEEFEPEDLCVPANLIVNASLDQSIDLHERFDLVLCLETAEHVPPTGARQLVENCVRHADLVLFSAALPGQGGLHHVNEQPPEYWAALFADQGYEVFDVLRPLLWDDGLIPVWYRQNMLLFVGENRHDLRVTLAERTSTSTIPLTRVHPDLMRMNKDRAEHVETELRREVIAKQLEVERLSTELDQHRQAGEQRQLETERLALEVQTLSDKLEAQRSEHRGTRQLLEVATRERIALESVRDKCVQLEAELGYSHSVSAEFRRYIHEVRIATRGFVDRYEILRTFSHVAEDQLRVIYRSTSWRFSVPARLASAGLRRLAGRPATLGFTPATQEDARSFDRDEFVRLIDGADYPLLSDDAASLRNSPGAITPYTPDPPRIKISFVSGEPETPGHAYRVGNMAHGLPSSLYDVQVLAAADIARYLDRLIGSQILWIWRTAWTSELAQAVELVRNAGARIVFDVDDLMFAPELATTQLIDGIRSQGFAESDIAAFYGRVRQTMHQADLCVTPTLRLAREVIQTNRPAAVIPNGYAFGALKSAAEAMQMRRDVRSEGVVRIGYAAGTRTHQRDFSIVVPVLAKVLRATPHVRLILTRGSVDLSEFPDLDALSEQIEWRDFVPLEQMLFEYARYTVNIVPLEVGNRYCESKSELKFFEAALVGVPTIASPTEPYAAAIRHGETGFLADTEEKWEAAITLMINDPVLRERIAVTARREVLWNYGPERRAFAVRRTIGRLLAEPAVAAGLFQAQIDDDICRPMDQVQVPEYSVLLDLKSGGYSRIAVVMPCYNYANYIVEALGSVLNQTIRDIDIVIVDDCSTDESVRVAQAWLEEHAHAFNRVVLLQNKVNSKLGASRNVAINFIQTELFFPLDPDNLLLPDCIERCLAALDSTGAAVAYPKIESFGDTGGNVWHLSEPPWQPDRLRAGNYIDAMALVRTTCWAAVGGYVSFLYGWEDYDLWCRFAEHGFFGVNVSEVTALYRYHGGQMIKTLTQKSSVPLLEEMQSRHPWTYPVQ